MRETLGCSPDYLFWDTPDEPVQEKADPWKVAPNLTESCTLSDLLNEPFVGKLAAHILAYDKNAKLNTQIKYQDKYIKAGTANIWDVQCNGILYRHFRHRIYSKRVAV